MMEEKSKQLIEKFPQIFSNNFYFECGDGWFALIETLCKDLQHRIDWKMRDASEEEKENLQVKCVQCKEKFGGLRFYVNGGDDYMWGMIHLAESMSCKICEGCGLPGKSYSNGWIRTHCEACEQAYQKRRIERFSESSGILVPANQDDENG